MEQRLQLDASVSSCERAMGIEPTSEAWEALSKTPKTLELAALSRLVEPFNWKMNGK
jgi:hypothetical protein